MKKLLVLLLIAVVATPTLLMAKGPKGGGKNSATTTTLDSQEIADAQWMREEEKLARDVYREMFALWGNAVFSNISSSEQSHMDAMGKLLARNNIADPVTSSAARNR